MNNSKVLPALIVFVLLEGIVIAINILPGFKELTIHGRSKRLVRAGIINLVLFAGLIAYLVLSK